MQPEILEGDPGPGNQVLDRPGNENFVGIGDIGDARRNIDGDTAELLVYLPDDGAKFVFYWFVCDGQGNITSGRYPAIGPAR